MIWLARSRTILLALTSGVFLAGCTSQVAVTVSMPVPIRLGPVGSQFKASFPHTPTKMIFKDSGVKQAQYGVGVQTNTTYVSGGDGPPEVDVWVESLTNFVPSRRVNPFCGVTCPHPMVVGSSSGLVYQPLRNLSLGVTLLVGALGR